MGMKSKILAGAFFAGATVLAAPAFAQNATVVVLTQTGCQFLESENDVDHGYEPKSANDCIEINSETGDQRLSEAKVLNLPPGNYIFRVENKNVPYPLGFWVREHDYDLGNPVHKLTKTSVSGGGLTIGTTRDYEVELEAGHQYVYSCPLNPTPNYSIVVN